MGIENWLMVAEFARIQLPPNFCEFSSGPIRDPVAPIAKKYRIVAMVTLRRQADFSRGSRQFVSAC
jgi:hypothetical protein